MKLILFAFILLLAIDPNIVNYENVSGQILEKNLQKVLIPTFQTLLDSAHVTGSILVYDPQADT